MKRLLTILFAAIVLATTASADTKIIDKSAKKAPEWLGTATEGFLVVTVRANSLADAQSKALDEITERIIKSVASNVTVSQTNVASEVTTNSGRRLARRIYPHVAHTLGQSAVSERDIALQRRRHILGPAPRQAIGTGILRLLGEIPVLEDGTAAPVGTARRDRRRKVGTV